MLCFFALLSTVFNYFLHKVQDYYFALKGLLHKLTKVMH